MTVQELKRLIEKLPDETRVMLFDPEFELERDDVVFALSKDGKRMFLYDRLSVCEDSLS